MAEGRIMAIREAPGITMERAGKMDMEITYSIDGAPIGTIRIPLESYTHEKAMEAVKEKLRQWEAVVGKPITLG
jgi:hypothetical protein